MRKTTTYGISAILAIAVLVVGFGPTHAPSVSAQDGAETYSVDKVHSSILFRVKHANASFFYGRFIDFEGSIQYDKANPDNSSINLTVQTESVRTWS